MKSKCDSLFLWSSLWEISLTWPVYTYPGILAGSLVAGRSSVLGKWKELKGNVLYIPTLFFPTEAVDLCCDGSPRPVCTHAVMKYIFCLSCLHVCCCITLPESFKIMEIVDCISWITNVELSTLLHFVKNVVLTQSRKVNQNLLTLCEGLHLTQCEKHASLLLARAPPRHSQSCISKSNDK